MIVLVAGGTMVVPFGDALGPPLELELLDEPLEDELELPLLDEDELPPDELLDDDDPLDEL
jgi:hypothetical protein